MPVKSGIRVPNLFNWLFSGITSAKKPILSPKPSAPAQPPADPDLFPVLSAAALFDKTGTSKKIEGIRALTGFHAAAFDELCRTALDAFAEAVQLAPASQAHHHAGPGGMIVHGIEVMDAALRRRKGYLLPQGARAEDILRQEHIWTYAIFAAALLHDIGKPIADQRITAIMPGGAERDWTPLAEPLRKLGATHYRLDFARGGKNYDLHTQLAMTMYPLIIPAKARDWLAQDRVLMAQLTAFLYGDIYKAGVIGEIVSRADGDSVAGNLMTGGKSRMPGAKEKPLFEKLLQGLRFLLVENKVPLNRDGAAGWVSQGFIWLLVPRVVEAVRLELTERGYTGIPANNERIFDVWQEHNCLVPNDKGRAVWTVLVEGEGYRHKFTAIKFPLSLLFKPSEYPVEMQGQIIPVATVEKPTQASAPPAEAFSPAVAVVAAPVPVSLSPPAFVESAVSAAIIAPAPIVVATVVAQPAQPATPAPAMPTKGDMDLMAQLDALSGIGAAQDESGVGLEQPAEVEAIEPFAPSPAPEPAPSTAPAEDYYATTAAPVATAPDATSQPAIAPVQVKQEMPPAINVIGQKTTPKKPPSEEVAKFMQWVQAGLQNGSLPYNESGAMVHFVQDGMLLVSPKIFREYAGNEDWIAVQRKFTKSGWSIKAKDGKFIWSYQVVSSKGATAIILNGVVVDPAPFISQPPSVNPYLVLREGSLVDQKGGKNDG